jgi:hypothetical protein
MTIPQLLGLGIDTVDESQDIIVSGIQEESIWNVDIQLFMGPDFPGLPRGDWDEICLDPYPGIIVGNYGKI